MDSGVMGHPKQVEVYEHGLFNAKEILSSHKHEFRPTTNSGSVIEFDIKPLPGKLYDVKSMTLFFKMGIRKKKEGNWVDIEAGDLAKIGFCNNYPHAIWGSTTVKVDDTEIGESTGNSYPYISYLQNLLSAKSSVQETLLKRRGFVKDQPRKFTNFDEGSAVRERTSNFTKSYVDFIIPIYNDIQTIEGNFLPPDTKMTVTLRRNSDDFVLIRAENDTTDYKIVLEDIHMKMFIMTPSPEALNRFYTRYRNKPLRLKYTQNVMKQYTVPNGNFDLTGHNLFFGENLPDQVFVVMQEQEATNGSLRKNPFYFAHFELSSANLVVNSVSEPSNPYTFHSTNNNIEMYYELLENTGTAPFEMDSINITPKEFRDGFFIIAWDRNPVKNNRVAPKQMEGGYMTIKMKTSVQLENNITVLAIGSYVGYLDFKNGKVLTENHF